MDPKSLDILNAALNLPAPDRAAIAEHLLATLAPEPESAFAEGEDDAFAAELERRLDDARRDPDATIPWSVLRNEP